MKRKNNNNRRNQSVHSPKISDVLSSRYEKARRWFIAQMRDNTDGTWKLFKRLLVAIVIFAILMGVFVGVSRMTSMQWDKEPTNQTIRSTSGDTSITFNNTTGQTLPRRGTYKVKEIRDVIDIVQDGTGKVQHDNIILRIPVDSNGNVISHVAGLESGIPAAVFIHGAGTGNADDSFNDVGTDLASAGFATIVMDKPRWDTWDATRDYPSSAKAYEKAIQYLRSLSYVDDDKVGIFTTSEGTWISPYVIRDDKRIAFEIMMSPMVFSPRHSLGFSVAQIFAITGANPGYQAFVQRLFSMDTAAFSITNIDFESQIPQGYDVPILVAYGAKDVLTAQVSGVQRILELAHSVNNSDVTIRTYPIGNHVLRLGDQTQAKTLYVDHYEYDFVDWAVGVSRGLEQTSSKISGSDVYQAIAVPENLSAHRPLTMYFVAIHVLMLVWLLASLLIGVYAVGKKIYYRLTHQKRRVFGFVGRYQRTLVRVSAVTYMALVLFLAGVGQLVWRVVNLIWGAAPPAPGMIYWSWYAIQTACIFVIVTWSFVAVTLLESISVRAARTKSKKAGTKKEETLTRNSTMSKNSAKLQPILASERLGIIYFNITTEALFFVLLVFAYWGLFIY
ncbi:alpha/beta hydrolase [Alloscardovia theropitheci]|uniref:Alpha/beta hydrolase n=1 Tax=Alloscardovia theropitheci TaxID=2496842 RepID=A0A4R0QZF3_9BIFI|nr:alpha/beta hydrolase [Alloscardovia theropitheci]TCD54006.1 alpha/beta hydrolase [Alloscardovia theropitheci]